MLKNYAKTPEGQIHYLLEGRGEALLLLHQTGLSSDQFIEVMPLLADNFLVIVPDLLGYGNSDVPPKWITIEEHGQCMVHFLDSLNIKRVNVFGRFLGASVGVELAAAFPERVDKLILSSLIFAEPQILKQRRDFWSGRRMQVKEDGSHLISLWQEHLSRGNLTLEHCQRAVANYMRSNYGFSAEDAHEAIYTYNLPEKLPRIKSPTLLLYSPVDSWLRWEESVRTLIPRSRTMVFDGTKYYPAWEKPQKFAETISEFIRNPKV